MATISFFVLDATYKVIDGKPIIHLWCKTLEGKRTCVLYDSFVPYFYVIPKQDVDLKPKLAFFSIQKGDQNVKVTKVEEVKKIYVGKEVTAYKVFTEIPAHVPILREELKKIEGVDSINENDILFFRRFLIDHKIVPMTAYEADGEFVDAHMRVPSFKAEKFRKYKNKTTLKPKILAVDIETYAPIHREINPLKNPILSIALYGEGVKKVFVWKQFDTKLDYVSFVKDEKEMLEKFVEVVNEYRPDILTGYFSDGFDLPYIKTRSEVNKVKISIGLDNSELRIRRGIGDSAEIMGITHFDVFKFVRKVMFGQLQTDRYNLNSVSEELLGEKKVEVDLDDLSDVWDHSPNNLDIYCEYNLKDTELTYRLAQKLLPNATELVKITGLTLFDVNRMGFSQFVEWYLLKQAPEYNQIAPNKPHSKELVDRRAKHIQGAFVFSPKAGLYNDIVLFDFLSLYPTIIGSHNLSAENVHLGKPTEDDGKIVPLENQEMWFSQKKKGFLPLMIEGIITRRLEIKEQIKNAKEEDKVILDAQQKGLKLLANSFYGYLGFYAARWYSLEAAAATTAFGRYYIRHAISKAEEVGFTVLYSDTDSVFLGLGQKKKEDAINFAEEINKDLPGLMELEFEGYYPSGIFVAAKSGEGGAKKRYALLSEDGRIIVKGFESVRRNTSIIAKEVQERVFDIVLKEHDTKKALSYAKEVIDDIRTKKIDVSKMVISIQLQKELDQYDARGPHVAVAEQMRKKGIAVGPGTSIQFIVTQGGDTIRDRAKMPEDVSGGDYDSEYYVAHQIIPSIQGIFNVLGVSKVDLLESKDQSKLDAFF